MTDKSVNNFNILFVAHGSRLPAYRVDAETFVSAWQKEYPGHSVQLCYLELMSPSFHDALEQLEDQSMVVPLFLHEGWHLKHDISDAISDSNKQVVILPPLTSSNNLLEALCGRLKESLCDSGSVIIYSHGNRVTETHIHLHILASELQNQSGLNCRVAEARGEPSLQTELSQMIESGERKITILPHFLFSGAWQTKLENSILSMSLDKQVAITIAQPLRHHHALLTMVHDSISSLE